MESLEKIVWQTVHRQFHARRAEWFELMGEMHFVMWRVPAGHQPTLDKALARLDHLRAHGDSDHAFGWPHLPAAKLWRSRNCDAEVA